MDRLVPRDTPDPDGDRRFEARTLPLLEPVGWEGERHRGGYGTRSPGGATISLQLVFGPLEPEAGRPRLAVTVADPVLLQARRWSRLAPSRLARPRTSAAAIGAAFTAAAPPARPVRVIVDGESVELERIEYGAASLACGEWNGYALELEADELDVEGLELRRATAIPPPG